MVLHAQYKKLTASISQVLDQRTQLLHHFAAKKSQDRAMNEIHVSSVNCIVIIGSMPEKHAQKSNFDLFRHSLKDIVVITFDELLEKLKELQRIMCATTIDNVYIS
ncbi:hypothetical protein CF038_24645 [Klebsiella michiganensis]|uniref:Shedu anti-phage system protein SduA domain-containing protein n=1 Tax=Klebsiella michiganensis TaxID=1134687 RepID=UPI001071B02D|nr:hypothetical protein [Klebsiella michiganensis]MBW5935050.1 hypothetical protein [Klebsiella michiganensis]MBW5995787.1 hypothetical protein [Klebsiella michiganensis]MBX4818851.1 hypothetical protein [Klebsiella michiganensis]